MRNIEEFTEGTSAYELFTHIYWCIINRKITLVSDLDAYLKGIPEGPKKEFAFKSAFKMLKEMHWGFFSDLDTKTYPVLWKKLTIPHSQYPAIGELKRSMTITDIYTAFIDIHGYTAFCQKHGRYTSMLRLLDNCIENDIREICRNNHVMGNRARGDEIILVGTSAYDVMNTVIMIADYFGEKKLTDNAEILKIRSGQALKLPKLSISAGIAGGKKYAVMVITAAGDLSGSVVNTAARLQSRANKISNNKSHILTTSQVVVSYKNDVKKHHDDRFSGKDVAFLDLGPMEFKGIKLQLAEVVIEADQMYRVAYQDAMAAVIAALKSHSWSDRVFVSITKLVTAAAKAIPPFEIALSEANKELLSVSNSTIIMMMAKINNRFIKQKDYSAALVDLKVAAEILVQIENFDHAVLLYLQTAIEGYSHILEIYNKHISAYSDKNKEKLLGVEEIRKFEKAKMSSLIYNVMKDDLDMRIEPEKRKRLWMQLAKDLGQDIKPLPYLDK